MKNHAFIFSALFITGALFPLPEFSSSSDVSALPRPRHLEEIAYDKKDNALYLFGGAEINGQSWSEPDNLFQYKDQWEEINERGPIGRRGHILLYDESSGSLVMFGGVAQTPSGRDSSLFDMWRWHGGKWKILDVRSPFKECRAVYDSEAKRILAYGDIGTDQRDFELWEFKSAKWSKLSEGGPTDGPFPLAYNPKSKTISLLQWKEDGTLALWEWQNRNWKTRQYSTDFPLARNKYAFAYSTTENALFIFGGVDSRRELLGDFWKFDGNTWKNLTLDSTPSPRASLRLLDSGASMLLYGGVTKTGLTNELWEFKNSRWTKK
jgi:hypothetical protein